MPVVRNQVAVFPVFHANSKLIMHGVLIICRKPAGNSSKTF